jgi:peptide/nickel transport system ATP-binding protein
MEDLPQDLPRDLPRDILRLTNLCVSYGRVRVVDGFSLTVRRGEAVSFVGESGSGKTTVARAIMGLLPQEGKVEEGSSMIFDGEELTTLSPQKWAKIRGEKISMIFQDSGNMLNPVRSVGSQFAEYILTRRRIKRSAALRAASEALYKTGLSDPGSVLKSYPFQLSGGMRQRVGIAMAMVFSPELLLADEPTSALDATTQKQVIEEIVSLKRLSSMTMILVTHNLGVAAFVSDRIAVLKNGRIVEEGKPKQITQNPKNPYTRELLAAVPSLKETRP